MTQLVFLKVAKLTNNLTSDNLIHRIGKLVEADGDLSLEYYSKKFFREGIVSPYYVSEAPAGIIPLIFP